MAVSNPRKVFERVLLEIGREQDNVVVVSCDSAKGAGLSSFIKAYPDRYVEAGISEQNAMGVAAGLAKQGFIPIIVAITPFITMRCYEQVRDDVGYVNMNVKIIGSGGGLAYSTLGSTHEALEDVALMRTIPHMTVFTPGDGFEVEEALWAAVRVEGPVYLRMPRQERDDFRECGERRFRQGKAEVIGNGTDVGILTYGPSLEEVLQAAQTLETNGISVTVANFCTVKPLDEEAVCHLRKTCRILVSVEEHSLTGGLGSAAADVIATIPGAPLYKLGVPEGGKEVGPYREVLEYYGIGRETLPETVKKLLCRSEEI